MRNLDEIEGLVPSLRLQKFQSRASKKRTPTLGKCHMGVSKNTGTPKSSILIGFSIINHPFGGTPIFGNTHIIHGLLSFHIPGISLYFLSKIKHIFDHKNASRIASLKNKKQTSKTQRPKNRKALKGPAERNHLP